MKVIVQNFAGSVGKSIVAKHLVQPNLPGSERVVIESLNTGGEGADSEIKSAAFADLTAKLMILDESDHIVVDIGASNIESVMTQLKLMQSAESDFDHFIIPTSSDLKQQRDTINTAVALGELGVSPARIHVIMNRVADVDTVEVDFAPLIGGSPKYFKLCPVPILESRAFDRIGGGDTPTVHQVASDEKDLRAAIAAEPDKAKKMELAEKIVTKRFATSTAANLNNVWTALSLS